MAAFYRGDRNDTPSYGVRTQNDPNGNYDREQGSLESSGSDANRKATPSSDGNLAPDQRGDQSEHDLGDPGEDAAVDGSVQGERKAEAAAAVIGFAGPRCRGTNVSWPGGRRS